MVLHRLTLTCTYNLDRALPVLSVAAHGPFGGEEIAGMYVVSSLVHRDLLSKTNETYQ